MREIDKNPLWFVLHEWGEAGKEKGYSRMSEKWTSLYESIWIICIYGKCFVLSKREWTETTAKCFTSAVTTETMCSTSLNRRFECSGILEYNHNPKCSIREFVVRDFHIKISWCSFRIKHSPGRQYKVHHWKRKMSNSSVTGSKFHNE